MKNLKIITISGLIFLLLGCNEFFMVCSINPFYVDENIVMDNSIEGLWSGLPIVSPGSEKDKSLVWKEADTTLVWKIERYIQKESRKDRFGKDSLITKPSNFYTIKLQKPLTDSTYYQFKMVLFRVKGMLYADIMPLTNIAIENSRMVKDNFLLVHTLARVKTEGSNKIVSWLSDKCMRDMIENKHVRAKYVYSHSVERLMLTGPSAQLSELVERHGNEKRFIDWDEQPAMMKLYPLN